MSFLGLYSKIISCVGTKSSLILCLTSFSGISAYAFILGILFICGLGVPIPEDITLIASGILIALGKISFQGAIIAGLVGVLIGDALLFFVGRRMGKSVFELPILKKLIPPHKVKKAEQKILANSKFICFVARFLPGLRSPIFLTAGVMGIKTSVFIGLDGLAALISVPFWVYTGWWVGENWDANLEIFKELQVYLFIAIFIFIALYIIFKRHQSDS